MVTLISVFQSFLLSFEFIASQGLQAILVRWLTDQKHLQEHSPRKCLSASETGKCGISTQPTSPHVDGVKVVSVQVLPFLTLFAGLCWFGNWVLQETHSWRSHDLHWQRRENASAVLGQEWEQAEEMTGLCWGCASTRDIFSIRQIQPVMLSLTRCKKPRWLLQEYCTLKKHVFRRRKV